MFGMRPSLPIPTSQMPPQQPSEIAALLPKSSRRQCFPEGEISAKQLSTSLVRPLCLIVSLLVAGLLICNFFLQTSQRQSEFEADVKSISGLSSNHDLPRAVEELENRPHGDRRKYQYAELPNGLRVLNIQDAKTFQAAVAVSVKAGSFNDPTEFPGLAHFCEHMLFLGTERYPSPSGFDNFASKHGGSSNAFTASEVTVYYGEVSYSAARQELQRLADFFRSPLFRRQFVHKEVHAINSEHLKNVQNPELRVLETLNSLADPRNPVSRFHTGNLETLYEVPKRNGKDPVDALKKYFAAYYCPEKLQVVSYGPESLEVQLKNVQETFGKISSGSRSCRKEVGNFANPKPFPPDRLNKWVTIEGTEEQPSLWIQWQLPDLTKDYGSQPLEYLLHVLGYEGVSSFVRILQDNLNLATQVKMLQDMNSAGTSLYMVIYLTAQGRQHVELVLDVLYVYIGILTHHGVDRGLYRTIADVNRLEWDWSEPSGPSATVGDFAERMTRLPAKNLLTGDFLISHMKPELVSHLLYLLRPDHMNVAIVDKDIKLHGQTTQELPYWDVKFNVSNFSDVFPQSTSRWDVWLQRKNLTITKKEFLETIGNAGLKVIHPVIPIPPGPIKDVPKDLNLVHMHAWKHSRKTKQIKLFGRRPRRVNIEAGVRSHGCPSDRGPHVWYRKGWVSQSPKVNVRVTFKPLHQKRLETIRVVDRLLLGLYSKLLAEELEPKMVDITLTGVTYSVAIDAFDGLTLTFTGFAPILSRMVNGVLEELNKFNGNRTLTPPDRFERIVQDLKEELRSYTKMPVKYAIAARTVLLHQGTHSRDELLNALENVSLGSAVAAAEEQVLSRPLAVNGLAMGNLGPVKARHVTESIARGLSLPRCRTDVDQNSPILEVEPVVRTTGPIEVRMRNPRDKDPNDVTVVTLIDGVSTVESQVIMTLLGRILQVVTYNELRTVRQLGYVVDAGAGMIGNVGYIAAVVQGTALGADDMDFAIESVFTRNMVDKLRGLTEAELESYKDSMVQGLVEPPVSISKEMDHFWSPIELEGRCFGFHEEMIKYLNSSLVTRDTLESVWKNLAIPSSGARRKVAVKYFAKEIPRRREASEAEGSMVDQQIPTSDIPRLLREHEHTLTFDRADSGIRQNLAAEGGYYDDKIICRLSNTTLRDLERANDLHEKFAKTPGLTAVRKPFLDALFKRVASVADDFGIRETAVTLESYSMMKIRPGPRVLDAVGTRVAEAAPRIQTRDLTRILSAYGSLGILPVESVLDVLGRRMANIAANFSASDLSTVVSFCADLRWQPEDDVLMAIGRRVSSIAANLTSGDVTSLFVSYAKFSTSQLERINFSKNHADPSSWALPLGDLGRRVETLAPNFPASEISKALHSYDIVHDAATTVGGNLSDDAAASARRHRLLDILGESIPIVLGVRLNVVARDLGSTELAVIFEAYGHLGISPGSTALHALSKRLKEVVHVLSATDVVKVFLAIGRLKSLQTAG